MAGGTGITCMRFPLLGAGLGHGIGVTRPLLFKWRGGSVMPSPAQLKLLVDLVHVMARAALIYAADIAIDWLFGHNS